MLTRWLLILPRCTKNVMHSLSFFPFSLPKSPLHSLILSKTLLHKLQNSALLHLPPLWQSSRSCHIPLKRMWNQYSSQLIKLPKRFELIMPCDWYLPAIKVRKLQYSEGVIRGKVNTAKRFWLQKSTWSCITQRGKLASCALKCRPPTRGFTQRWLQVKCNKLVHKPHDLTPTKFLILQNKRVWGSFSAPSCHSQLLGINDSGASLPAGKLTQAYKAKSH